MQHNHSFLLSLEIDLDSITRDPLIGYDNTDILFITERARCHLILRSPDMHEHVGLGSPHPCDAKNPPAIAPWLPLLLFSCFFSSHSAPPPTPSPPTLLFPSRWHIGPGVGREGADPEEQLEGVQLWLAAAARSLGWEEHTDFSLMIRAVSGVWRGCQK